MPEDKSTNKNDQPAMPAHAGRTGEKKESDQDIKKARKIVLATIGQEEEKVKIKKKKGKELKDSKPLFFKDKNFKKFEKEHQDLLIDDGPKDEEQNKKAVEEIKKMTEKKEVAPVVEPIVQRQQEVVQKDIKPAPAPAPESKVQVKEKNKDAPQPSSANPPAHAGRAGALEGKTAVSALIQQGEQKKDIARHVGKKKIKAVKKVPKKIKQSTVQKKSAKKNGKNIAPLTVRNLKVSKEKKEIFKKGLVSSVINNLLYITTIAVLLFIIFYSFLIISITQLNLDNKITRKIADYIPVPAIITKFGIVEYYDYMDLMNENKDNDSDAIVKNLILNNTGNKNIDFKNEKIKLWKLVD